MSSAEKSVQQLRQEIGRRLQDAAALRQRSDVLMATGDVEKGIAANVQAQATENAVAVLRGKLAQLLPSLVGERLAVAVPEIEARARKRRQDLADQQKRAEAGFVAFFRAWNGLLATDLGRRVTEQLFGDFGARVSSAATGALYKIALGRRRTAEEALVGQEVDKERGALQEQIRAEVAGLAAVDAVEKMEVA